MGPGDLIDGKYRIEGLLGEGGMGRVFAATHIKLGTTVAIKVLRIETLALEDVGKRFLREARAASRLRSEHVGRVIDVDQLPTGEPYMVMELLHGSDLHELVRKHGPLAPAVAAEYILQASEALAEAHSQGMVHRDIKPGNLFLAERSDGTTIIKVLDFGIATRPRGEVDGRLTRTATIIGSPSYMSPEQLRSAKDVDARSDVWSLGVTLYELISGRHPFSGDSFSALSIAIATDPHAVLDQVPLQLGQVIDRCLAKLPADRYASVAELGAALAPLVAEGARHTARISKALQVAPTATLMLPSAPAEAPQTTNTAAAGQAQQTQRTHRRRLPVLAAVAVALAAIVVVVVIVTRDDGSQATSGALPQPGSASAVATTVGSATPRKPSTAIAELVATYEALAKEIATLRQQLERSRVVGDDKLSGELAGQISERERAARAQADGVLQGYLGEFVDHGTAGALRGAASVLELAGETARGRQLAELADRIERKEPLPDLPREQRFVTQGELALSQHLAAVHKEIAQQFERIAARRTRAVRLAALDPASPELARAIDSGRTEVEAARKLARARVDAAKKQYALDGKPQQLLNLGMLLRLAGDLDGARKMCDQYAKLDGTPAVLDADADGVLVCVDDCPTVVGARGQPDGCALVDTDGDTIGDAIDKCPTVAEVVNNYKDDDGCPDRVQYCVINPTGERGACFGSMRACQDDTRVLALGDRCGEIGGDVKK